MTIRDIAIAFGYKVDKKTEKAVNKSISDLKNTAKKALGAIGVGLSLVKANALIEEFKEVNLQLKNAVGEAENFEKVQNNVLNAANNVKVSYSTMTSYVKSLMNSQNSLFSSSEKTLEFAQLTTKAMKAAGANESVISSLNSGIQSAFESGKVSAGTFTTLMQNCPEVVSYLSQTLGVTEKQVKALGTAGAITSNQLYSAFTSNASAIEKAYGNVSYKISDAVTYIRNEFGMWLYQMDDVLDVTHTIAKVMMRMFSSVMTVLKKVVVWVEKLTNKLGGAERTLGMFAALAGGLYAAMNAGKIISFLTTLKSLLSVGSLKVMAIIAVVMLLVMIVEDFFQFLKGNDSMFGEILTSMGIDAEATREQLLGAFGSIKDALKDLFETLKNTLGVAFEAIKPALKTVIELLVKAATDIIPLLAKVITSASSIISKIAEAVLPVLGEILGKIIEKVAGIIEKILPKVLSLIEKLLPFLEQIIDAILPILVSLLDIISPILDAIFAVLDPLVDIVGLVLDLLGPLIGMLTPIITILIQLVEIALMPVIEAVKLLSSIIGDNLSSSLNRIKAVLEPVIKFLETMWTIIGKVYSAISELIGKAITPLREAFEKLFDVYEKIFGGGLFGGDKEGGGLFGGLKDKISGLFNGIKGMGEPSQASGVLNNSTSNKSVTQNVTITNEFNGGSAEQQKNGAKAMNKAGGSTTGLLAKAISYLR